MTTISKHDMGRLFTLYAELLWLHGEGERLSDWLSGAAYRIRQMEEQVAELSLGQLNTLLRAEVVAVMMIDSAALAGVVTDYVPSYQHG